MISTVLDASQRIERLSCEIRVLSTQLLANSICTQTVKISQTRVSDPYSFFTDPDLDPEDPDGGQYGSVFGSNPDPGL
jgi:hypothetical protein